MQLVREIGGWIAPTTAGSMWGLLQVLVTFDDDLVDTRHDLFQERDFWPWGHAR